MKLQSFFTLGLVVVGLASPAPMPEFPKYLDERQIAPRNPVYDILGNIAFELVVKPALQELGLKGILPTNTQVVDLSERSLNAISNIVTTALRDTWFGRDKASMNSLVQNCRDYTRNNQTEGLIITHREIASGYLHRANELINLMIPYGLPATPSVLTLIGIWSLFKKEEVALTRDIDVIHKENDHLTKLEGFRTRYDELLVYLKASNVSFYNLPYSLYRTRFTTPDIYPCPGCVCKQKTVRSIFESRSSTTASWKVEYELSKTWPYCGKTPQSTLDSHRKIVNQKRDEAIGKFKVERHDEFLTSGFDRLVATMQNVKTWDADKLINSLFVDQV